MRYPLSVMKIKSHSSSPGVDWGTSEGETAGEMVSLHPAAMNWGLTHTTPSPRSPGYKPPLLHQSGVQHEVLLTESGFLGKQLLAAGPPIAGGGGSACTRLRSHVGAVWGVRASLELGAWQGSPTKLPLTSGDGEQHSFIATASSLTAVWLHPHRLDPRRKIQLCAASGSSPKSDAALFLSQSAQQNPHPQHAGGGCRREAWDALSQVYFCWQTVFYCFVLWCNWEDIGFFSSVHPRARSLLLARFWSSISEARFLAIIIIVIIPRKLPISLSHGTRACDSMSHREMQWALEKAWGKTYSYRKPSFEESAVGSPTIPTPCWALGWCVFQKKWSWKPPVEMKIKFIKWWL